MPKRLNTDEDIEMSEAIDKSWATQHDECQKAHREVDVLQACPECEANDTVAISYLEVDDDGFLACGCCGYKTDNLDPSERRVDRLGPAGTESMKICYQCEKRVVYLFDDGRCKDCTGLTAEEVRGEIIGPDEE
jgi:Zn ribbon nucleic-acid-binding protein